MKNRLIILLVLAIGLQLSIACTSGDDVEGENVEVSDSMGLDSELDSDEFAEDMLEQPDGAMASQEEGITDEAFESSDEVVADLGDVVDSGSEFGTATEVPLEQVPAEPTYEVSQDTGFDTPTSNQDEYAASDTSSDTYASEDTYSDTSYADSSYTEEASTPSFIPLKKMFTSPYQKNGRNLNTIYMARPGDTAESISRKIYGDESRAQDLISDNPHIADGVKATDKVYYQSPNRPDDMSTMLTYYEDKGIPSQVYVTKEGDNIRDFSKNLLGYDGAWKEIWATNLNVDSKNEVPAGIELKYWLSDEGAEPSVMSNVASNDFSPPPSDMETISPPPAEPMAPPAMEPEPMMPSTTASNEVMPPAPEANVAGTMEPPPLPPPPPINPPETARKQQKSPASLLDNLDQDTMITLGGAAILALLAITMVARILKRNRSRKMKLGQTQV